MSLYYNYAHDHKIRQNTKNRFACDYRISNYLKNYYTYNNGICNVKTYEGYQHYVKLSKDGTYLYSETGLGNYEVLYLRWFDVIVDCLRFYGGTAKKGNARGSKVGYGKCTRETLCYLMARYFYDLSEGDTSFDAVFMVCAILENAGICQNEYGYLKLNKQFMQ